MASSSWPKLSYEEAKGTYQTLHLFTQIVGKIKLAKLPWINHSWHVVLLVMPYGFTTGDLPDKEQHFQIDFDLCAHKLRITTSAQQVVEFGLERLSVAAFYNKVMQSLNDLGIAVKIRTMPSEIADATPFEKDEVHNTYSPEHARALHQAFLNAQDVLTKFRGEFSGKCSPVHLFWGGFDMAVTRFSGRKAPKHPGGVPNLPDRVAQEAYSQEVSSAGFWLGNEMLPEAAFYSYAYPEPEGYKAASVKPAEAYYHQTLGEFILPYSAVQSSSNPEETLLNFLHSTYTAAADLSKWNREGLEMNEEWKMQKEE